jgi:hypothetical protein
MSTNIHNPHRDLSTSRRSNRMSSISYINFSKAASIKKVNKFEVLCSCGKGFEDADTYLQHKPLCETSFNQPNQSTTTPDSAVTPEIVSCVCKRTFKSNHALQDHARDCTMRNQKTAEPEPAQNAEPQPDASPTRQQSTLPEESSAKPFQCPCGKAFPTEKAMIKHLRYAKTHQADRSKSSKAAKSGQTARSSVPPDTVPTSPKHQTKTSPRHTTDYTLPLQGSTSPHHNPQASQARIPNNDSLSSMLSSLTLNSESDFCACGRRYSNDDPLRHRRDRRCRVHHVKDKQFNTPRPEYVPDGDLKELVGVIARQDRGGEDG